MTYFNFRIYLYICFWLSVLAIFITLIIQIVLSCIITQNTNGLLKALPVLLWWTPFLPSSTVIECFNRQYRCLITSNKTMENKPNTMIATQHYRKEQEESVDGKSLCEVVTIIRLKVRTYENTFEEKVPFGGEGLDRAGVDQEALVERLWKDGFSIGFYGKSGNSSKSSGRDSKCQ